jgi:hypothetical protein
MDIYSLDRPKKGLAIIINNLHNEQKATRNDVTKLKAMFQKINVQLDQIKIDQDKNELLLIANNLKDKDLSSYNLFFLVVLSHGILGDKIVCMNGTNQSTFDIEYFVENLSQNRSMTGFPKILIFDFCRGGDVNLGEMKQTTMSKIPLGSDVFVGFSTSKGYASVTGTQGSPFINALCNCIESSFDKESFLNIFQNIQDDVSHLVTSVLEPSKGEIFDAVQVPELKSTLRKQLYLLDERKYICLEYIKEKQT